MLRPTLLFENTWHQHLIALLRNAYAQFTFFVMARQAAAFLCTLSSTVAESTGRVQISTNVEPCSSIVTGDAQEQTQAHNRARGLSRAGYRGRGSAEGRLAYCSCLLLRCVLQIIGSIRASCLGDPEPSFFFFFWGGGGAVSYRGSFYPPR